VYQLASLPKLEAPDFVTSFPRPAIARTTKLSEVQRLLRERKPIEGRARMVRSIQQSLRVEGYDVATGVVAKAVEDVFRSRGWG
jgi:hypothetical protein